MNLWRRIMVVSAGTEEHDNGKAMLAGHPALDAADAMRDSYDAARYGQGKALEYIQRS